MINIEAAMAELDEANDKIRLLESELAHAQGRMQGMEEGAELLKNMLAHTEEKLQKAYESAEMLKTAYEEEVKAVNLANAALEVANHTSLKAMARAEEAERDAGKWNGIAIARKKILTEALFRWQQLRADSGLEPDSHIDKLRQAAESRDPSTWGDSVLARVQAHDVIVSMDPATPGGDRSAELVFINQGGEKKVAIRGVDFPCEGCAALQGSTLDNGWYRCNGCGYPSK